MKDGQNERPWQTKQENLGIMKPIATRRHHEKQQQWDGWGTQLKPAHEPIVLARKPIEGTITENVLNHGTGGLNIDETRIEHNDPDIERKKLDSPTTELHFSGERVNERGAGLRLKVASLRMLFTMDREEVLEGFPETKKKAGERCQEQRQRRCSLR